MASVHEEGHPVLLEHLLLYEERLVFAYLWALHAWVQKLQVARAALLFKQLYISGRGLEDAGSHVREVPEMQGQRTHDESLSSFAEELASKDP
eukprot:14591864-Heterocapsa_arctica.AAC.1